MLRAFHELPLHMQTDSVKKYYCILEEKQSALRMKRVMDVFLALILTIVLSPVMLVLAVMIKLDSAGPVFYRQERITRYGKPYRIFKFRTMVMHADKKGPLVTGRGDDRITKVGKKIRKARLDEIPQLFNVLTGDMSFVGTRPEVPKYVSRYSPEMMATLLLPAGITSKASIDFREEDTWMEQCQKQYGKSVDDTYVEYILPKKMKYNLQYLRKFSIALDLKIMLETALAVIK